MSNAPTKHDRLIYATSLAAVVAAFVMAGIKIYGLGRDTIDSDVGGAFG